MLHLKAMVAVQEEVAPHPPALLPASCLVPCDAAALTATAKSVPAGWCRKRLHDMIQHMTERLAGKIGNANNNAFMLRKLFKMYDTANTGQVCRSGFTRGPGHQVLHAEASECQAVDAQLLKQSPAGGQEQCNHSR